MDVRPTLLNRATFLRRHHRLSLPLLAPAFSSLRIAAPVTLCSSSGWAHGIRTSGRKVVYCYAPARWLYETNRYLGLGQSDAKPRSDSASRKRTTSDLQRTLGRYGMTLMKPRLKKWDQNAARQCHRYITSSTAMVQAIKEVYGIEAELLPPPPALGPNGPTKIAVGLEPGFLLCVSRLLPYKNVDVLIEAVQRLPGSRLVVVGDGPDRARLQHLAGTRVYFAGKVDDATLRWLYANSHALVAASYEDYGLTPLEAATFGRPSIALAAGGFLDTVVHEETGLFFDRPHPDAITIALRTLNNYSFDSEVIRQHASEFG